MIELTLPIKTVAGQNAREHHMARARRARSERESATWRVLGAVNALPRNKPLAIRLTRISAGTLDAHDNLPGSLKNVVDGIADAFGMKDNDPRLKWSYAQEKCKRGYFGVRIEIEPLNL